MPKDPRAPIHPSEVVATPAGSVNCCALRPDWATTKLLHTAHSLDLTLGFPCVAGALTLWTCRRRGSARSGGGGGALGTELVGELLAQVLVFKAKSRDLAAVGTQLLA